MTENEAIEVLKEKYTTMSMCISMEDCKKNNEAVSKAIHALEEVQKYHAIGTVEEIRKVVQFLSLDNDNGIIEDLELLNKYRFIGTVEECREARERQRGKKRVLDSYCGFDSYECPVCGTEPVGGSNYCHKCGQRLE